MQRACSLSSKRPKPRLPHFWPTLKDKTLSSTCGVSQLSVKTLKHDSPGTTECEPRNPNQKKSPVSGFEEFPGDVGLVPKGTKERLLT